MELLALWKIVRRRWWLIAVPALVALAYAVYGYIKAPPTVGFSTRIRFTGAVPPEGDVGTYEDEGYFPWTSSEYVAGALDDWVRTSSFAEEVSAELAKQEIDIPADALRASIAAEHDRSVMVLILGWSNPDDLMQIAGAATTVLQTRSGDYWPQLAGQKLEVIALDKPAISPVPPPVTVRFEPVIRFGLGLVAGIALAFLVEYLDPTLRERAQIEELGLPVLVEIPRERGR